MAGKSDNEHLQNLENVLQKLQDNGLRANIDKCSFLQDMVVNCGHEISKEGLQKTKDKSRSSCKYSSAKEHYTATSSVRVSELLSQVFTQPCYWNSSIERIIGEGQKIGME